MKAISEWNKVDPKDAKIIALTTQVSKLEKDIKGDAGKSANSGSGQNTIDSRHTKKKGESIALDGVAMS